MPFHCCTRRIEPVNSLRRGVWSRLASAMNAIELYVPDAFAYDEGVETFKLLATTQPTDFSWMQQETVRSIDSSEKSEGNERGSLLQQLFDLVYNGFGTRDAKPTTVPPADEWTTVERTFVLRRKVP